MRMRATVKAFSAERATICYDIFELFEVSRTLALYFLRLRGSYDFIA